MILERDQPFSTSLLWRLQRRFFAEQGLAAWSTNTVPHYITNNPRLADAFARVVLGHLRDHAGGERTYIVELGAGSGRFAHHFLRSLLPRLDASGLDAPITYVLTDTVPALLEHWRTHPRLREHVARGALDFALFDATAPAPLDLVESGTRLAPGAIAAPLVVIANYVFDSIPCDCFRVADDTLSLGVATISSPRDTDDATDPAALADLQLVMSPGPLGDAPYGDPALDAILAGYRARLADTAFTFPIAALRCLAFLRQIGGGALALVSDRGIADAHDYTTRDEPKLALHGSFSLLVNFDALATYAVQSGGFALQTAHRTQHLEIVALGVGLPGPGHETRRAYHDAVEDGGPADAYLLKRAVEPHLDAFSLAELLAYLRVMHHDARVFLRCFIAIANQLADASDAERAAIALAATRVEDAHFSIGEDDDPAAALALLRELLTPDRLG